MDIDREIAIIEKYNIYNDTNRIIETITVYNSDDSTKSFVSWASKLKVNTFEIYSTSKNFRIVFTIYSRISEDKVHYIIINTVINNKIVLNKSYKIQNEVKEIDIYNMSDIISFFIRVCKDDIIYMKDKSIVDLIEFQMKRIATEIE